MFGVTFRVYLHPKDQMADQPKQTPPPQFSWARIDQAAIKVANWPDWMKGSPVNERNSTVPSAKSSIEAASSNKR